MCRSYPDVNKLWGMETTILGQHPPFMSIKSFVQHSGWQEMVSLCSLIRFIGVCADRDQPEFLCSRSDSRCLKVHVATAGGWLTRYRPREVRNSIYRYRKIHIDYRSKFLYRFISSISIIYGNTFFNIFWGKNRFNLHIIPSDLDILFDIFCTCPFHVKCWSIVKPKKSKSVTRSIICSFNFNCGIRFSMFRCLS